ncbi:MAG: hypothetical protein OEM91_05380 [Hyphomicrobiales bacterium]|nr:hypothetical protein [Hyphomicrobiales bacterium]
MRQFSIFAVLLPAFAAIAALTAPVAAAQEENWLILLREQLLAEQGCQLNYTTNVRKYELGGEQAIDARAHCFDKRMFDASWLPKEQRYQIRVCEPVVC